MPVTLQMILESDKKIQTGVDYMGMECVDGMRERQRRPGSCGNITEQPQRAPMKIETHDPAIEERVHRQIRAIGAAGAEEALLHLLEPQEEQDRWLLDNREAINAKIRRGLEQLDRGDGIPEGRLDAYLAELKARPE